MKSNFVVIAFLSLLGILVICALPYYALMMKLFLKLQEGLKIFQ